jgi:hypothetical protein
MRRHGQRGRRLVDFGVACCRSRAASRRPRHRRPDRNMLRPDEYSADNLSCASSGHRSCRPTPIRPAAGRRGDRRRLATLTWKRAPGATATTCGLPDESAGIRRDVVGSASYHLSWADAEHDLFRQYWRECFGRDDGPAGPTPARSHRRVRRRLCAAHVAAGVRRAGHEPGDYRPTIGKNACTGPAR